MADVVKTGYLKRYSKSFLDGGWNIVWVVLHKDSILAVYKKQGDTEPKFHVNMKDVCKYFAYGQFTEGMPDRPPLPAGKSIDCLLAIPAKPSSKAKIFWFLADDPTQLHSWMEAICSTLPPPKTATAPAAQIQHQQPVSSAPLPYPGSSAHPQPGAPIGFDGLAAAPPLAGYPQQPYPQQPASSHQSGYNQPYPQHPYAAYPQQQYASHPLQPYSGYPQPQYAGYPQQQFAAYPQGAYGPPPPPPGHYYQQQPVVYASSGHKKKSNLANTAAAVAGGALLGYGASRMFGGFGLGPRWGSWSSLSSFGSGGSFGSFGSWD